MSVRGDMFREAADEFRKTHLERERRRVELQEEQRAAEVEQARQYELRIAAIAEKLKQLVDNEDFLAGVEMLKAHGNAYCFLGQLASNTIRVNHQGLVLSLYNREKRTHTDHILTADSADDHFLEAARCLHADQHEHADDPENFIFDEMMKYQKECQLSI